MAFSAAGITGLVVERRGADLCLAWTSGSPAGTPFQVYVDGRLAWSGASRFAVVPAPAVRATIAVGSVAADEAEADLSGAGGFPALPLGRARVEWTGGTYLGDVGAFAVYRGAGPGAAVDYSAPVAVVPAAVGQAVPDGFGLGGFGEGGFGQSAGRFSYTSPPLPAGTWNFGVRPRSPGGLEGTAVEAAVVVAVAPRPPAMFDGRDRVRVSAYNPGTRVAQVAFNASPDHSSALTDEIQEIATTGTVIGGALSIAHATWSPAIAVGWDETAAGFQAKLDANSAPGNFVATGGPWPGTPLRVRWTGPNAGTNQAPMTFVLSTLFGGGAPVGPTTIQEGGL